MAREISILTQLPWGEAFKKAQTMGAEKVVDEVKNSELRGRGGAGFLTGLKWEMTRFAKGDKVVVCNADEGELGTFKDRKLLCEHAEKMFEGMAIACYAVGANLGIVYLRWEYSDLTSMLEGVIEKIKPTFSGICFDLRMGAGAYVCGEETALLDSLEGRRGEPRNKPPFPVKEGYLGRPTVINNVETFCCIPHIILEGADAFAAMGTDKSRGPKLFSISGDVEKPGVYEFTLGISLDEVLQKAGAKNTKAALVGGSGGVCVAAKDFGRKLAFEDLPPGGSIIVFNATRTMLHILENIMEFFVEESCGQCVPCREGTYRMYRFIRTMIEDQRVSEKEMRIYRELAETMQQASKCGLGQSAPNAFISILDNFSEECVSIANS